MMDIADAIMESDSTDGAINDPKTKVIRLNVISISQDYLG